MNEDLKKFSDLMLNDEEFQKKLAEAASNYKGEQTEKAVFEGIVDPLAKEYGVNITCEDFMEAITQAASADGELINDELAQVAGGSDFGGLGANACSIIGAGIGATTTPDHTSSCFIIGVGDHIGACFSEGVTYQE